MPIEVRELVIKATVSQGGGGANTPNSKGASGPGQQADVNEIVALVLEKIKEKMER